MGLMYAWATKDYCLDELSLPQLIKYYQKGWDAKQAESRIHWGMLATLLNGGETEPGNPRKLSIDEIKHYPGYENAYINEKGKIVKG